MITLTGRHPVEPDPQQKEVTVDLRNGVVVAPQPLAVEEGVKTLKQGGNAFEPRSPRL